MDDDNTMGIDAEAIQTLKGGSFCEIFDTTKFEEDLKALPAWCVAGIDPETEVHESEKSVFEASKTLKGFQEAEDSLAKVIVLKKKQSKPEVKVVEPVVEKADSVEDLEDWLDDVI